MDLAVAGSTPAPTPGQSLLCPLTPVKGLRKRPEGGGRCLAGPGWGTSDSTKSCLRFLPAGLRPTARAEGSAKCGAARPNRRDGPDRPLGNTKRLPCSPRIPRRPGAAAAWSRLDGNDGGESPAVSPGRDQRQCRIGRRSSRAPRPAVWLVNVRLRTAGLFVGRGSSKGRVAWPRRCLRGHVNATNMVTQDKDKKRDHATQER